MFRRCTLGISAVAACLLLGLGGIAEGASDFDPLRPMLGNWSGRVEIATLGNETGKPLSYDKTMQCRMSDDGDAFVMVDTEVNPWTKKRYTTTAVSKFDRRSKTFKAMVTDSDGGVRLFVIRVHDKSLEYDLVDRPEDVKFKSTVTFEEDGTLREEGFRSGTKPTPYTTQWTGKYTRDSGEKEQ